METTNDRSISIVVENRFGISRVYYVEPWGEDYTLLPKEKMEIRAWYSDGPAWFHLVEDEAGVQVWIEGSSVGEFEVTQDGTRLECGHQRQSLEDRWGRSRLT